MSRKRNRTRQRQPRSNTLRPTSHSLEVGKWKLPFRPRKGLLLFLIGFPIFFGLRLIGQWVSGDTENMAGYFWWAILMAACAGLLATFTKVFDD